MRLFARLKYWTWAACRAGAAADVGCSAAGAARWSWAWAACTRDAAWLVAQDAGVGDTAGARVGWARLLQMRDAGAGAGDGDAGCW